MRMSRHAETRCQQRGIPFDSIPIIMTFGTPTQKSGNATEYQMLEKDVKWLVQRLDKLVGKTVIVGDDDTVITTYTTISKKHFQQK
jgi:hypothetical protein